MCKHCDCHIPGDMFDLRYHLEEDHKIDTSKMMNDDVRNEYKIEISVKERK